MADLLADVDGRIARVGAVARRVRPAGLVPAGGCVGADEGHVGRAARGRCLATTVGQEVPDAFSLELDLDLSAPAPRRRRAAGRPRPGSRASACRRTWRRTWVCWWGPGVLRVLEGDGAVEHLQRFAAQTGLAIVNTWGAKGVFPWDSPFHAGTAGLQERDFELAGLTDKLVVVCVGVDDDELLPLGDAQRLDLHPVHLAFAAEGWPEPSGDPPRPPLYTDLSAVVGPAYASDARRCTPLGRPVTSASSVRPADSSSPIPAGPASGSPGPSRRPSRQRPRPGDRRPRHRGRRRPPRWFRRRPPGPRRHDPAPRPHDRADPRRRPQPRHRPHHGGLERRARLTSPPTNASPRPPTPSTAPASTSSPCPSTRPHCRPRSRRRPPRRLDLSPGLGDRRRAGTGAGSVLRGR